MAEGLQQMITILMILTWISMDKVITNQANMDKRIYLAEQDKFKMKILWEKFGVLKNKSKIKSIGYNIP